VDPTRKARTSGSGEQDGSLSDHGGPVFFIDGGQRGELQHSQGLPPQLAHGCGGSSAHETPCGAGTGHGVPVRRGGNGEALESSIALPRRLTSALWMLVFLMPAEVRRSLPMPPESLPGQDHRQRAARLGGQVAQGWSVAPAARSTADPATAVHDHQNDDHCSNCEESNDYPSFGQHLTTDSPVRRRLLFGRTNSQYLVRSSSASCSRAGSACPSRG
jgi:hypothetical protein